MFSLKHLVYVVLIPGEMIPHQREDLADPVSKYLQ